MAKVGQPHSRKELNHLLQRTDKGQLKYNDHAWMNTVIRALIMDLLNKLNAKDEFEKQLDILPEAKKKAAKAPSAKEK